MLSQAKATHRDDEKRLTRSREQAMASNTAKTATKVLYKLPPLSTAPNDGVSFWRFVRFEFARDDGWYRGGFEFKGVVARRERGQSCSTAWHSDAADRLVEIENSDWLKEI